jgi:hypothetical protein
VAARTAICYLYRMRYKHVLRFFVILFVVGGVLGLAGGLVFGGAKGDASTKTAGGAGTTGTTGKAVTTGKNGQTGPRPSAPTRWARSW